MRKDERCPACGSGRATPQYATSSVDYHGKKGEVRTLFKRCDECGSEFADAEVSRLNKRALLAYRKAADGLLRGDEIRALRERFHLSQKQAAQLFGGGPVAFSKYENDDVAQSEAMDKLLRLALGDIGTFGRLVAQCGLQAEFPESGGGDRDRSALLAGRHTFDGGEVISVDFAARMRAGSVVRMRPYKPRQDPSDELQWK